MSQSTGTAGISMTKAQFEEVLADFADGDLRTDLTNEEWALVAEELAGRLENALEEISRSIAEDIAEGLFSGVDAYQGEQ